MATEVTLPALGESVTEGTVTRWLKQVGDSVAVDEALLEVSTDKVDTEIPSPVAGTLLEIKADEDETVEVGAVLAVVGEAGESSGESSGERVGPVGRLRRRGRGRHGGRGPGGGGRASGGAPGAGARAAAVSPSSPQPRSSSPVGGGGGATTSVTLPALGESVTEGTVTRWLKQVGDAGRRRRGAARGVHRQGGHRDPLARRRHAARDQGRTRTRPSRSAPSSP